MSRYPSRYPRRPEPSGLGVGWWLWAAVCGLIGLTLLGVVVWAIVRLTTHFTGGC